MNTRKMLAAAASCGVLALFATVGADAQTKKLPLDANGQPCDGVLDGALQCFKKEQTISTPDRPYRRAGESDGRRYGPGRGFTLGEKQLIYAAVPGSVLWLMADNAAAAANLRTEAARRGIAPGRLVVAPRAALPDHPARHACADLFLDTLPYNAHTTASDALWAGLPLLTCAGATFAGRVAASLLTHVGLPDLVASSPDDYERRAVALATDPQALAALRARLEANRMTTPLFDTARFTRQLERAFEAMHARRREGLAPDHLAVAAE